MSLSLWPMAMPSIRGRGKQQNGIPMSKMNGATRNPRQHYDIRRDPPGSVRMTPYQHPHMGPVPMVGTFRGPPPQPIIIGTSSYSRGTYPRGMYPRGNPSRGMHARGTHSRANPYMAHMAQYPPMAYPYFFGQQYPVQVVYVSDSEDSDSTTSGRSTVRERKSRYHRQFVTSRVPSTIIIKEMDEDRAEVRQSRDVHKKRSSSPVKAPVREEPVIMRTRSRSPSRSRSRSPPMAIYQDLRISSRPPAEPARKEEKDSSSEFGTFQPAAGPKSGDVSFVPKGYKPPERNPTPEPEDYTYATVIKPQPVKATPPPTDDWGEPDQDIGSPSQNIGLSMSERLQGIVEDGWGTSPLTEVPPQDLSRSRNVDLRKSKTNDETDVYQQSRQPDENPYTHNINRDENPYARSVKGNDTYPPPSPPLDIPSTAGSPRQSFHRDYPSSEPDSPDRPITPPFDGITPRPSVKSRSESPPRPSTSVNPLSQSQSQKAHRSMFSNDVLKELKQRQKSTDNLAEDDDSQSRSVNFSPSPPTIISQDNSVPPPPPLFNGIPAPPPPPPLPQ
ncbi:serine/arginine repetitive matrix protein 1-like isoform X2 [Pecten maximus]|uniref:serine/arginine repetitive matrix protein 1-like isoform X2 n=1 Tax=Pecten maximus TaxID=6579 RepID=UPI001458A441|nr:serine/arginine repetitive matrix protein 1-like isoform X2 [Pecten maximus]